MQEVTESVRLEKLTRVALRGLVISLILCLTPELSRTAKRFRLE
jgi:hypothetical protein